MKTTKAQYKQFKDRCLELQKEFGLMKYHIYFELSKLEETPDDVILALLTASEPDKTATITLSDYYEKQWNFDPVRLANHEMAHLLIHRLSWLGTLRYAANGDIREEDEAIASTIENFLTRSK